MRKGIDPSIVVTKRLLTEVLIVVVAPDCVVLVMVVIDGCGEVVVVMSSSNNIMDLNGILGDLLASPVPFVVIFKFDDVWLSVPYGNTPDGSK